MLDLERMLLPLRYPRLWLAAGWSLIALATIVSLLPTQKLPNVHTSDKFAHAAVYTVIAIWFVGIYPKSRYVVIGVGLFLLGLAIEGAQSAMNLGRQADVYDVLANAAGIGLGLGLGWLGLGGWAQRIEALVTKR